MLNLMYINGEWTGENLEKINIYNPSNNEIIGTVPKGGESEAHLAINAAHEAFTTWSKLTAEERSTLLRKWYEIIDIHKEELGEILTKEQGKPLTEAIGEIKYANGFISWYSEEAKRVYGETIPSSHQNKRILVQKQPIGVVAAITPWNFPAAMITRKVGPALAAGCTVVVKPAGQTPLTALKLAELSEKAGIPKGVINVVTGDSQAIGNVWLQDERVRKITFTGSTEVGKFLMRESANTVKKVSLELGGHAPFIVMDDANIDKAVSGVINSKFRNAGQTCICTNRIYVHESIEKEFIDQLVSQVSNLRVGDGMNVETDIGPLIDRAAIDTVIQQIEDAKNKGAKIEFGGKKLEDENGSFFEPTVLSNVTDEMVCMLEETFGPLAPITTFKTEEEVVARANNTNFGLAAYVFTENLGRAIRISENLEYGIIGLNDGLPSVPQAPFGGFKESGLGREGGHHGIEEFLEVKYISIEFS
ncbi:NAD-dependent succinate-semialdehyde dehydrogenase [Alkalihalobacillus deserti]|uniref:NAD-dependent succinate-semialdehyde dehydrogenase n=1 Tax=Alkalihalobacillus deserti TaxID=2879466 RepID=UPI001D1350EB|nr:NAD-dependent succinate-semialdehyde dehydrogenase [Alkalihalobacillus deserti]